MLIRHREPETETILLNSAHGSKINADNFAASLALETRSHDARRLYLETLDVDRRFPAIVGTAQGIAGQSSVRGGRRAIGTTVVEKLAGGCVSHHAFLVADVSAGAFPLKDADFYWHLRTGDLIRQTGRVPHVDIFTFERLGTPWIDLHWVFQIGISWAHEYGGVVALNLAKCGLTCLAVFLLITARRPHWPVWVMVLAWLPALLVLGGRMYVRPETLTLLYLAVFLAVLFRWNRRPALAFLLPLVQVAWVNSQGLFVLGPVILLFALLDSALRPGAFAPSRESGGGQSELPVSPPRPHV